jgi:hypothetical protein
MPVTILAATSRLSAWLAVMSLSAFFIIIDL